MNVTVEDVVAVLTAARAKKARLVHELALVKAAFAADSSMENFRLYYHKQSELDRASTSLIMVEGWAAGLKVDGVAR